MDILHFKELGDTEFRHEYSFGVNLVNFLCSFRYFTSVSKFKAIGRLLMEILHFKDVGCYTVRSVKFHFQRTSVVSALI